MGNYFDQFKGGCFADHISIGNISYFQIPINTNLQVWIPPESLPYLSATAVANHFEYSYTRVGPTTLVIGLRFDPRALNLSPFVNQQGKAAYSEMVAILNLVTLGPDANVKQLPSTGPAPDSSNLPSLKLVLSPNIKKLKKGDVVNVQAVVEHDENAEKPLKFEWTGDHAGSGSSVQFLATKPGKPTLAVNVTGVGSAAVEFEVEDLKAQIRQASPADTKIMVGSPATFSAQLLSGGQPLPGNYVYRWQPTPDVKFDPAEGPVNQAKAVFSRPGLQKVFVQVLEKKGEILQTIAESDQLEIEVIKPDFKITFEPQSVQLGREVKAVIQLQPADMKDIDFRWELTPNGKLLRESQDKRQIIFTLRPRCSRINGRVNDRRSGNSWAKCVR